MLRLFETEESPAVSIVYYLNHTYKHLHLIFTMSATPKRSHEESAHSSSKYRFEDAGPYPKLSTSVLAEYRPPYEIGQDTRLVKIPRTESRDMDRRSPLPTMYRMLPSSNDSHVDYPATSENRLESKDSKDSRDYRFDNRDTNLEMRELYGETRKDSVHAKNDKDVRYDSSRDDNNEIKYDRESNNDTKSEVKMVKDGCGVSSGHLHRKESKEYHRGKRYSDILPGITDPWISRSNLHGYSEISKEGPAVEEKDHMEGQGAVGDSKFDSHGEDKFKDKDRKRKDEKHRDLGERNKERSDRLSSMHVANISNEYREPAKEDRDVERKDPAKDKERLKEKEKGHTKREMWDGVDKETSHNEKALGDGSNIMLEQENLASEKNQKEVDRRKSFDKESKDRRNEKDVDVDRDGSEKHDKGYDKESNDGGADEGASEREQEVYNYGIQQHRRMQRSRGSPHLPNREPHFRTRPQGNEGSQDKTEVSSVIYKVGECMQNLIKLWREYEVSQVDKHSDSSHNGPSLEIRIPAEHVIAINRQVRGGQLWGTDIYTDDSDLVAVLMHTGYCRPTACPPPPAIQELHATIRVLPPQDFYISTLRNNVRSRAWGAGIGCSYQVERCCFMKKGGGTIDLERCITRTSTVEPTLEPVSVERTMTTRSTASNAFRQQRLIQEITIQYNLCNEPWIKYSISIVADKGLKKPLYTSARLRKGEVLYLETHTCRYELCFAGEKMIRASQASHVHEEEPEKSQCHHLLSTNDERNDSDNSIIDVFRWSHCKKPLPQKVMRSVGIPLPLEYMEVLEDNLNWEDIQWSQTGVWVAGKEYTLARVHFLSMN